MKRGMHTRRGLLGELWERVDWYGASWCEVEAMFFYYL